MFVANIYTTGVVLETERLKLVPISAEHINDIFKEFTPEITTYMFPQPSGNIEDTRKFVQESLKRMKKEENFTVGCH